MPRLTFIAFSHLRAITKLPLFLHQPRAPRKLTAHLLTFLLLVATLWPGAGVGRAWAAVAPAPAADELAPEAAPASTPAPDASTSAPAATSTDASTPTAAPAADTAAAISSSANTYPGEETANLNNSVQKSKTRLPEADESTGALVYNYPFALPPGRNGLTPNLSVTYNSQTMEEGSIVGYGWSLSIPAIERQNKHGANELYTRNDFTSSLSGELVDRGSGSFGAKVEGGDFLAYTLAGNTWTVRDKKGTVYTLGATVQARQDNPGDATQVYKWMLERQQDVNGNFIRYEYYKDQGQIYPSKIFYTGSGVTDGVFEVEFLREARTDPYTSYRSAFAATTSYRLREVQIKFMGAWLRKYQLGYTAGSNNYRSLLTGITETGKDEAGMVVSLPAVTFGYSQSTPVWTYTSTWQYSNQYAKITRLVDANGDGYVDALLSHADDTPPSEIRVTNTNTTQGQWSNTTGVAPPILFEQNLHSGTSAYTYEDEGVLTDDFNGDLLPDIVQGLVYENAQSQNVFIYDAYVNVAGQSWSQIPAWNPSIQMHRRFHQGYYGVPADFNGDGLADIYGFDLDGNINYEALQLNQGSGFGPVLINVFPPNDIMLGPWGRLVDVNRDGLADNLQTYIEWPSQQERKRTFINQGSGSWFEQLSWAPPLPFYININGGDNSGLKLVDINADGLVDLFNIVPIAEFPARVYLNTGNGWQRRQDLEPVNPGDWTDQTNVIDVNGDGLVDIGNFVPNGRFYLQSGMVADLLNQVTYSEGGSTNVTYKPSTQYRSATSSISNPKLPLVVQTVYQITTSDGLGTTQGATYTYEGGEYYYGGPFDRKFAGFSKITKVDLAGNQMLTYYHQGNASNAAQGEYQDLPAKIGYPYRVEQRDASGNLYQVTVTKWDKADLGSGASFVEKARQTVLTYDGNATHRDTAEEFIYDTTNGNLLTRTQWGETTAADDGSFTDLGSDKLVTTTTYSTGGGYGVIGLPSAELTLDQAGSKVKESRLYYDALPLGSVDKGNATKAEQWVSGTTYVNTQKTYNSYGLVTQELDARGKATTYAYDSYNLYPATVTNALNQPTQYLYDYSLGKPKQVTDVNNFVFQTVFDGLDRVAEEKQPDLVTPSTLVTKALYVYTDTPLNVSVQKRTYLDASTVADSYAYFDGLGRQIQQRSEAEAAGTYNVVDTVYNSRGLTDKQSLPYASSGASHTAATTTPALLVSYTYDAAGRVTVMANVVGSTTNTYDDWVTTTIDPKGNVRRHYQDAYGNLIQVDEVNGSTYVTRYSYNGLGALTAITDAAGNVRSFTYDGLGRRLTAQDLHAPADATFGTWQYVYDNVGNLTSRTDAKSQVTLYTYDDVNRMLIEDYQGQVGTEVTYIYDTCPNGVGRLCTVTSTGATEAKQYNALGQLTRDTKTMSATAYPTDYTYDWQGNQLTITNPDSSIVKYVYNPAGQLEQVQRKEAADGAFTNVVTNFDYGSAGGVVSQVDANGVTTTNTYDAAELYRLRRKLTVTSGGTKLQDTTYTYDAVGNISRIVDASQTNSAKTVDYTYDALNRLLTAVTTGAANGQNYSEAYTYDAIGNILTKTGQGAYTYAGNVGSSYANPHAVTQISATTYSYDANGNMLNTSIPLPWYPPAGGSGGAWTDRKQLTIDKTKVAGGADLADFPVLVSVTDASLKTVANGGKVGKSDGTDILFTAADGLTKLNHEIERYTATTGELVAWVRVPVLSASVNTVLIMYYGNAAASDQQNKAGTWNSNYAAVYHFGGTAGEASSAAGGLSLSMGGTVGQTPAGRMGAARELTSVNTANYLTRADAAGLDNLGQLTIEAWLRPTDTVNPHGALSKRADATNQFSYGAWLSSGRLSFTTGKNVIVSVPCPTGKPQASAAGIFYLAASANKCTSTSQQPDTTLTSSSTLPASSWVMAQLVFDGSQVSTSRKKMYLQGALNVTGTANSTIIPDTAANLDVFRQTGDANGWVGQLDELRIVKTALTPGWIATEYANQSSPATFYTLGPVTLTAPGDTFTWDYANRLTGSTVAGSTESYAYDASGQRVKYTVGSITTMYPAPTYNTDGTTAQKHIMANGVVVATIKGTGVSAVPYYVATDHLTGSNVVTSSTGVQQELLDYYPFGSIRLDEKAGSFTEQRKFTGQEYDVDTGLSYMNARYYNGTIGRFISQDPLATESLQTEDNQKFQYLLANPQNWNTYSYALNNPLVASDPSGMIVVTVSGTTFGLSTSDYLKGSNILQDNIKTDFKGQDVYNFAWSGKDNNKARLEASKDLSTYISSTLSKYSASEPLNIACHSHGCNVVALYTQQDNAHQINNLIGFGQPVLSQYTVNETKVDNHINIYSNRDQVQNHGGNTHYTSELVGGLLFGFPGALIGHYLGWGEFGRAGRTIDGATEVNATKQTPWWRPMAAHSDPFNNQAVWDSINNKVLK